MLYKRFGGWIRSCYGGEGSPGTQLAVGTTVAATAEAVSGGRAPVAIAIGESSVILLTFSLHPY